MCVTLQRAVFVWLALALYRTPALSGQATALVSLTQVGDHALRSAGFTLRRPLEVRIYAMGEGSDPGGSMNDYAWIISDDSHAFGDWNDEPPDDPDAWGIVVRRAEP
jgi:hypothetical protein